MTTRRNARSVKATQERDRWMSVEQAKRYLGKSRQYVLALVVRRAIRSEMIADRIVLRRADVERLGKAA